MSAVIDRSTFPYLPPAFRCEANTYCKKSYRWGFSFIQLLILLIVLFIWTTGICMMWFKNRRHLPLQDESEVPRGWRAVQELSRAMERELLPKRIDVTKATDRETKRKIRKRLRGGTISLHGTLTKPDYRTWPAFWSWAWREKWWMVVLFSVVGASIGVSYCIDNLLLFMSLWTLVGLIPVVIWLGTTVQSRVFMFMVSLLVVVIFMVLPSVVV